MSEAGTGTLTPEASRRIERRDQLRELRARRPEKIEPPAAAGLIPPKAIRSIAEAERWLNTTTRNVFMSHAGGPQSYWANDPHRERIAKLVGFRMVEIAADRRSTVVVEDARLLLSQMLAREAERLLRAAPAAQGTRI